MASGDDAWQPLRAQLAADVRRVADRLRSLPLARLDAPPAPPDGDAPAYASRAAAAREVAEVLAAAAARLEATGARRAPTLRRLPELRPHAAGDQVAVTGHDLLAALDRIAPDQALRACVAEAARRLADLRRRL